MNRIKKILIIGAIALGSTFAFAADNLSLSVTSKVGITNSVTSVQTSGYLDSIYLKSSGATPVTITLSTPKETFLSCTFTNSAVYRVRLQTCDSSGSLKNQYDRLSLFDAITLTAVQGSGTDTVACVLRLENAMTQ